MKILRIPVVLKMFGFKSRTSLYKQINEGLFTRPVAIGPRAVGIPEHEVLTVLAHRVKGDNLNEIRAVVARLHHSRVNLACIDPSKGEM